MLKKRMIYLHKKAIFSRFKTQNELKEKNIQKECSYILYKYKIILELVKYSQKFNGKFV